MTEEIKQHTERRPAWTVSWWKDGRPNFGKEGADRVEVMMTSGYPSFVFQLPNEASKFHQLENALEQVFSSGKAARSRQIMNLLTE